MIYDNEQIAFYMFFTQKMQSCAATSYGHEIVDNFLEVCKEEWNILNAIEKEPFLSRSISIKASLDNYRNG